MDCVGRFDVVVGCGYVVGVVVVGVGVDWFVYFVGFGGV